MVGLFVRRLYYTYYSRMIARLIHFLRSLSFKAILHNCIVNKTVRIRTYTNHEAIYIIIYLAIGPDCLPAQASVE